MSTQTKIIVAIAAAVVALFALPLVVGMAALFITIWGWGPFLVIAAIVVVILLAVLSSAMRTPLERSLKLCDSGWSDVDALLRRRHDLISTLVQTVDSYVTDGREVLERVTLARNAAVSNHGSPASRARDENALAVVLRQLLAIVEDYPDLKANELLSTLQRDLVEIEDRIQRALWFYNSNVRDYNNRVQSFPSELIAAASGFKRREFFYAEFAVDLRKPSVKMTDLSGQQPPERESSPIPVGIVEPAQTERERTAEMAAQAVQEAPSPRAPEHTPELCGVTRRTSRPAWPGWPSGFAGPDGPSC